MRASEFSSRPRIFCWAVLVEKIKKRSTSVEVPGTHFGHVVRGVRFNYLGVAKGAGDRPGIQLGIAVGDSGGWQGHDLHSHLSIDESSKVVTFYSFSI